MKNTGRKAVYGTLLMRLTIAMLLFSLSAGISAADKHLELPEEEIDILILHSYYSTYEWSELVTQGILNTLSGSEYSDANMYYEYMDAKRHPEDDYLENLNDIYNLKYKGNNDFDLIICSDNYAIDLVCSEEGVEIFGSETPVVFVGPNSYDPAWKDQRPELTGVIETLD